MKDVLGGKGSVRVHGFNGGHRAKQRRNLAVVVRLHRVGDSV